MLDCRTGGRDDIYRNEYAGEFVWTKENNVFGWGKLLEGQEKELSDDEKSCYHKDAWNRREITDS